MDLAVALVGTAHLTEAKRHDIRFSRTLALPNKGSVVVMDRGYVDSEL